MKKGFFKVLAKINRVILPSVAKLDLARLSKKDKLLVAYKYWVTINSLD